MNNYYFSPNNGLFNGVFAYINQNMHDKFDKYVNIQPSSDLSVLYNNTHNIFPPSGDNHIVIDELNGSFTFNLTNFYVSVNSYSIKSSNSVIRYLKEWKLEGAKDDSEWELLHYMENCDDCNTTSSRNFRLNHSIYNSFKLTKYGMNVDNSTYFDLYGFDIFGVICSPFACGITFVCTNHVNMRMFFTYLISSIL